MTGLRVEQHADSSDTARAAARCIAEQADLAVRERGRFAIALSGGRTPGEMLKALAGMPLPWPSVHVFQVDERVAPDGDAARNLEQIRITLIETGALARENLHPMPVEDADLEEASARYAARLEQWSGSPPVVDVVHLGLGDDGHTASLVPGDPALECKSQDVAMTDRYRGHRRMTLTLPALDRARQRLWLATGADKSAMLARLIAGDESVPAGRVTHREAIVFTDRAASVALPAPQRS